MTTSPGLVQGGNLHQLAPLSLVDRATESLREAILRGNLLPGQVISISDISASLGISHIPVREAMRRLESAGLMSLRPGRSAVVAAVSVDDLKSIFHLRSMLEGDLAGRSSRLLTRTEMEQAHERLEEYQAADDAMELSEAHHQLHLSLLRPAITDWDERLLVQLWHASTRYLYLVHPHIDNDLNHRRARGDDHEELIRVTVAGDVRATRRVWRSHLRRSEAMLRIGLDRLLESTGSPEASLELRAMPDTLVAEPQLGG